MGRQPKQRDNSDIDGGAPRRSPSAKAIAAEQRQEAALDALLVLASLGPDEELPTNPAPAFTKGLREAERFGYAEGLVVTETGSVAYKRIRGVDLPVRPESTPLNSSVVMKAFEPIRASASAVETAGRLAGRLDVYELRLDALAEGKVAHCPACEKVLDAVESVRGFCRCGDPKAKGFMPVFVTPPKPTIADRLDALAERVVVDAAKLPLEVSSLFRVLSEAKAAAALIRNTAEQIRAGVTVPSTGAMAVDALANFTESPRDWKHRVIARVWRG